MKLNQFLLIWFHEYMYIPQNRSFVVFEAMLFEINRVVVVVNVVLHAVLCRFLLRNYRNYGFGNLMYGAYFLKYLTK